MREGGRGKDGPCEMKMNGCGGQVEFGCGRDGDGGVRSRDEDESQRGSWRIREGRIFK